MSASKPAPTVVVVGHLHLVLTLILGLRQFALINTGRTHRKVTFDLYEKPLLDSWTKEVMRH